MALLLVIVHQLPASCLYLQTLKRMQQHVVCPDACV